MTRLPRADPCVAVGFAFSAAHSRSISLRSLPRYASCGADVLSEWR
jgi:hypothetical protein